MPSLDKWHQPFMVYIYIGLYIYWFIYVLWGFYIYIYIKNHIYYGSGYHWCCSLVSQMCFSEAWKCFPYTAPFVAAHQQHLSALLLNHPSESGSNTFLPHLSPSATESCVEKCHFKKQKGVVNGTLPPQNSAPGVLSCVCTQRPL